MVALKYVEVDLTNFTIMLPAQFLASSEIHSEWTWSEKDNFEYNTNCGLWNCRVDGKKITFANDRSPSLRVRGTECLRPNFVHYWQMKITEEEGSNVVPQDEKIRLGIRTLYKSSVFEDQTKRGYVTLSNLGNIHTDHKLYRYMPNFGFPVTIGILLDLIDYRMWFFKDGHCMGISPFADKYYHIIPVVIVVNAHLTVQLERCLKSGQRILSLIKEPAWKAESSLNCSTKAQWTWNLWKGYKTLHYGTQYRLLNNTEILGIDDIGLLIGNKPLDKLIHRWDIDAKNVGSDYDIIVGVGKLEWQCRNENFLSTWSVWGFGNEKKIYHPNGQCPSKYNGISKGLASVIFDGQLGTMTYFLDGRFLHQPFNNLLTDTSLYPIIVIKPRRNNIEMPLSRSIPTWDFGTLEKRCMGTILKSLRRRRNIEKLPIPECIMNNFDTFR